MPHLRTATRADVRRLRALEEAAETMLVERLGSLPWSSTPGEWRTREPGFVVVSAAAADGEAVGFAHVLEVARWAHLEQLAVHPDQQGGGHGRALVEAAKDEAARRGHRALSLTAYAEVPWQAPFYATCGFVETEPVAPFHRRLLQVEREMGLGRLGRRLLMVASLTPRRVTSE